MKKISLCTLLFLAGTLGCNAAKQAGSTAPATSMTAKTWVTTISNFIGGHTDTVTAITLSPNGTPVYDGPPPAIGNISCANGGITYAPGGGPQPPGNSVVGPACFVALGGGCNGGGCVGTPNPNMNLTSSNAGGNINAPGVEVLDFTIGVPTDPVPNGSTFNIQYAEFDSGYGVWQMDGTGTINGGVASGTWVCDPSTPACSGISGTFTATQQ